MGRNSFIGMFLCSIGGEVIFIVVVLVCGIV